MWVSIFCFLLLIVKSEAVNYTKNGHVMGRPLPTVAYQEYTPEVDAYGPDYVRISSQEDYGGEIMLGDYESTLTKRGFVDPDKDYPGPQGGHGNRGSQGGYGNGGPQGDYGNGGPQGSYRNDGFQGGYGNEGDNGKGEPSKDGIDYDDDYYYVDKSPESVEYDENSSRYQYYQGDVMPDRDGYYHEGRKQKGEHGGYGGYGSGKK